MPPLTDADLLSDLTPAQKQAVTHMEGPLLVLAGAGSGKTRVITRRVAYLLLHGVPAGNILAITFTNKAAGEMKQRVESLLPGTRIWISTFHAMGAKLLRMYADRLGLDRNFTIYDQTDRAKLVKLSMEDAGIEEGRFNADSISGAISKAKNQLISPQKYTEKAHDYFTQNVAKVYPAYEARLKQSSALDFDDLLYWPALAMKNNLELRAELDARFRYVLIDEYQDTNQAQYAIARGLTVDYNNICCVGDPDQSIYKWRGSDIKNILDFERDYPTAKVLTLNTNYRSTKNILLAASGLIAHNKQRKPKDLVTDNGTGDPVTIITYETGYHEAAGIASAIKKLVQSGKRAYRDCAVFMRVNALSRALEIEFTKARVPFQIVKGLAFFDRKENKDVMAYLRLLMNPRDDISFLRVVNEPARGIGKISLEHLSRHAAEKGGSLLDAAADVKAIAFIKGKAATGLRDFSLMIQQLTQQVTSTAPEEVIRLVLDKSGYRAMLTGSKDEEDADRLANIEELITAASEFTREDSTRTLGDFLENVTLASDVDGWNDKQDCVSIMTMHSAKGLEFPVVFVTAMEQGLLPHERSLGKTEDIEEERRLAFVAITRAKEQLFVSCARLREFRGSTMYTVPSMFLSELPEEAIREQDGGGPAVSAADRYRTGGGPAAREGWNEAGVKPIPLPIPTRQKEGTDGYVVGMVVRHATYGEGTITEVVGNGTLRKIKVRFRTAGERAFIAEKVTLEIIRKPGK